MTEASASPDDPTQPSRWRPLRLLLEAMDGEIAKVYEQAGIEGFRPRFTGPLIQLSRRGPLTIRALAEAGKVTHSAMSQTIKAMRSAGLVESAPGGDGRTRKVRLAASAESLVPFLEAEWTATERALAELEEELPYALSRVVQDIEAALARKTFRARIEANLPDSTHP